MSEWAGVAAWNFNAAAEIHSYEDCAEFLGGNGHSRELGPNMMVRLRPHGGDGTSGYYAVVLYDTEIIRYYPDGTFSVDDGGYPTPTTRERMQTFIPEGFVVSFKQRELGLWRSSGGFPAERKFLWALDHSKRIDGDTRDYAEGESNA